MKKYWQWGDERERYYFICAKMLEGESGNSVSFSEFFAVGVENKQPCLADQLILNRFPVLREKKKCKAD